MDKKITTLYEEYKKGQYSRRDFISKLALVAGSTAAAMALLPVLEDNSLSAAPANQEYSGLMTEFINYPGATGQVRAYLAHPAEEKKFPAVLVIHEIWGLNDHILDVTRRFAREGFLAMAPDALSPEGGTPQNDQQKAVSLMRSLNQGQTVKNFVAAVEFLKTNPLSTGKVGCTGFCWGGGMTNQVAVNCPDLDAAVPYYGMQPSAEDVEKIKAPIMAHYGATDERIDAGIPAFEEALKKYHKEYKIYIYEGAGHAFNNDTSKERYNEKAAKLAWKRTIDFFKEKLE
ncbi:MAG TPA: dienelactone hydrolase family protein [Bacteroidales bacterium]|nr:dienelactone hydrolase family protein [Bacteroidales bacterium]